MKDLDEIEAIQDMYSEKLIREMVEDDIIEFYDYLQPRLIQLKKKYGGKTDE